jgi:hypothetical protein
MYECPIKVKGIKHAFYHSAINDANEIIRTANNLIRFLT